jgi:hypothetical protein
VEKLPSAIVRAAFIIAAAIIIAAWMKIYLP